MNKENGSLKQSLDATNASSNSPRDESSKSSPNGTNEVKVIIGMQMENYELDTYKKDWSMDYYMWCCRAGVWFLVVCVSELSHFCQWHHNVIPVPDFSSMSHAAWKEVERYLRLLIEVKFHRINGFFLINKDDFWLLIHGLVIGLYFCSCYVELQLARLFSL